MNREAIIKKLIYVETKAQEKKQGSPIYLMCKEMCSRRECSLGVMNYPSDSAERAALLAQGMSWKTYTEDCHGGQIENKCFWGLVDMLLLMSNKNVKAHIQDAVYFGAYHAELNSYIKDELRKIGSSIEVIEI